MDGTKFRQSKRSFYFQMTVISLAIWGLCFISGTRAANAQAINEGFDSVPTIFSSGGWAQQNRSQPLGSGAWSQCGGTAIPPAHSGASTSCILVNFTSTTGVGTISNWLFAPTVTLRNGDTFSFYTKTPSNQFPDRLQVRLSTNGSSTNVGSTATSVGDFTTLLLDINPTYGTQYPTTWTQFTVTVSGLSAPTSGRLAFRYFVENGGPDGSNSNIIGIDTFVYTPAPSVPVNAKLDFDGDGKSDYVVVRNTGSGPTGQARWFVRTASTTTSFERNWGLASDFFVAGDFDGDGKDDTTVYRPAAAPNSFFYVFQSQSNTFVARELGTTGDDPTVVGDYDGDGKDDMAVYRAGATPGAQSFWYYRPSTSPNGIVFIQWGANGHSPVPGDFDGDGKHDFCTQSDTGTGNARFNLWKSGGGIEYIVWGFPSDAVAPGDYDFDGKTDFAVVRNVGGQLRWSVLGRNNNNVIFIDFPWGLATDLITQGDYDGDGRTDMSVWRSSDSTFYSRQSSNGNLNAFRFGVSSDYPVANYNVH